MEQSSYYRTTMRSKQTQSESPSGLPFPTYITPQVWGLPVDLSNRGNQDPFPKMNGLRWFLVIVFSWKTAVTQ